MSDHWEVYACQMDEHRAFVSYDHGISRDITQVRGHYLVKVRIPLKNPDSRGLPQGEEFQSLDAMEDAFVGFLRDAGGQAVGRVTVDGERHLYGYADLESDAVRAFVNGVAQQHTYALQYLCEPDPEREGYWHELYPSDEDWQVAQDLKVISGLEEHGDSLTEPRQIDHLVYFPSEKQRDAFAQWALASGYQEQARRNIDVPEPQYRYEFFHVGVPDLDGINPHTITLMRKAKELGGDYDGWGTRVLKTS